MDSKTKFWTHVLLVVLMFKQSYCEGIGCYVKFDESNCILTIYIKSTVQKRQFSIMNKTDSTEETVLTCHFLRGKYHCQYDTDNTLIEKSNGDLELIPNNRLCMPVSLETDEGEQQSAKCNVSLEESKEKKTYNVTNDATSRIITSSYGNKDNPVTSFVVIAACVLCTSLSIAFLKIRPFRARNRNDEENGQQSDGPIVAGARVESTVINPLFTTQPAVTITAQESLLSAAEHMSDEEDNVHRAMLKKLDWKQDERQDGGND
ncbi:uncharacterized protein LOC112568297 [Pomacea canaliculata]|uniref:uncharacterized protein LOC112568297 n=1 Tax=Pomacea canaliculata TaxID=400727 RepID=UPI000D72C214|nr:uncharacterized protein LOC112568297 [Pomacea canaliculata]